MGFFCSIQNLSEKETWDFSVLLKKRWNWIGVVQKVLNMGLGWGFDDIIKQILIMAGVF